MSNPNSLPMKIEHVLIITDSHLSRRQSCAAQESQPGSGIDAIRQHLQETLEHGDSEVFYMMAGAICLSDRNADGTFDIEPLLLAPVPVVVRILDWCDELANPHGAMIIGQVEGILNYGIQLSGTDCARDESPIIQIGTTIQLSFHLEHCTGGIAVIDHNRPPEYHRPPLVNSLSDVHRRVVEPGTKYGANHRGRSFYQVASIERTTPVGYNRDLIASL